MDKGQQRERAHSSAELWREAQSSYGEQVAAPRASVTRSGHGQVLPPHNPAPYLTLQVYQEAQSCWLPLPPPAASLWISDKVPTGNSTPRRP